MILFTLGLGKVIPLILKFIKKIHLIFLFLFILQKGRHVFFGGLVGAVKGFPGGVLGQGLVHLLAEFFTTGEDALESVQVVEGVFVLINVNDISLILFTCSCSIRPIIISGSSFPSGLDVNFEIVLCAELIT